MKILLTITEDKKQLVIFAATDMDSHTPLMITNIKATDMASHTSSMITNIQCLSADWFHERVTCIFFTNNG